MYFTTIFQNDERNEKAMTFDEKFRFVMENADSDKLQMIVAKEAKMSEEVCCSLSFLNNYNIFFREYL